MPTHRPKPAPRCHLLVPCAGAGSRAGAARPKQYVALAGRALVAHTLAALAQVARLQTTLVVLRRDDDRFEQQVPAELRAGVAVARCGGATRAATVRNGLAELLARGARPDDWVLVHDAARCLIRPEWVERLIDACLDDAVGGLLALPLADTLKAERDGRVAATLRAQRQVAGADAADVSPRPAARGAGARRRPASPTRPARSRRSAMRRSSCSARSRISRSPGRPTSRWPNDCCRAEARTDEQDQAGAVRIGEGWDTHALVAGRKLVLGGVEIAHTHGLLGHSDADALCHAITDALFGAAALGDIGHHFPDTDPQYRGADSLALLAEAARRVRGAGWQIGNVDSTIVAQAPKMAPHIAGDAPAHRAGAGVAIDQVSVKAKTAEKMGPVGRGEAIEARAVCLLWRG